MNCLYHPARAAVRCCSSCGSGLCSPCSTNYALSLCPRCNDLQVRGELRRIVRQLCTLALAGALLSYFFYYVVIPNSGHSGATTAGMRPSLGGVFYFATSLILGYRCMSTATGRLRLWLPAKGWIIYHILKIVLGFFVGLAYLPLWVGKRILQIIQLIRYRSSNQRVFQHL